MADFVHLHTHSAYSLLDGACRIGKLIEEAKNHNQSAVAITDHGVMYGVVDFYKEAKKQGIMADLSSDLVFQVLDKILVEKADVVEQYKVEQDPKILNFLVGQVMRETRGKANAQEVMEKLKEKIH